MPQVSVIIPAYNAMAYLPETMESVLRQTFTDFEVLIVDDGSSDEIIQWASQIADPRVKLISQENQGTAAARNTGIAHSQGEYVAFLDADDLWKPTKLEKQVQCLEDNLVVGLVDTWKIIVDEWGKPLGRVIASQAEGHVWKQIIQKNIVYCGSSPLVRRCCFKTVGLFSQDLLVAADWDMWIRIASHYTFAVVKEPLVCYRQHSNSMSQNWQAMLQELDTIIEKSFQSVSLDLMYLKNRSYGYARLIVAWKCLQSSDREYKRAIYFRRQALAYYPQLRYSWEYLRLNLAIAVMYWFGPQGYKRLRSLRQILRLSM